MIKDPEKRKWLGIVFILRDDFVSSLTDDEFEAFKTSFRSINF